MVRTQEKLIEEQLTRSKVGPPRGIYVRFEALDLFGQAVHVNDAKRPSMSSSWRNFLPIPVPALASAVGPKILHDTHQPLRRELGAKQLFLLHIAPEFLTQARLDSPRVHADTHSLSRGFLL